MPHALYVLSYADFDRYYESYRKDVGRGEQGEAVRVGCQHIRGVLHTWASNVAIIGGFGPCLHQVRLACGLWLRHQALQTCEQAGCLGFTKQ
jgi:hypothetical protein